VTSETVSGGAVKEIAALVPKPIHYVLGGRTVVLAPRDREIDHPKDPGISIVETEWVSIEVDQPNSVPAPLEVATLTGLVDYVKTVADERDDVDEGGLAIHVVSPTEVRVVSGLSDDGFAQRAVFLAARAVAPKHGWGTFADQEAFVVWLLTAFVDTVERASVLALVGNLREEAVRQSTDDGVSQTVVARKGMVRVENVVVPNPVRLAPYRTFREVEQPHGLFLLRLRGGGEDAVPTIALFEADGGLWRLDAIGAIRDWLRHQLGEDLPIIA
jgi:hypothetical protein